MFNFCPHNWSNLLHVTFYYIYVPLNGESTMQHNTLDRWPCTTRVDDQKIRANKVDTQKHKHFAGLKAAGHLAKEGREDNAHHANKRTPPSEVKGFHNNAFKEGNGVREPVAPTDAHVGFLPRANETQTKGRFCPCDIPVVVSTLCDP